MRVVLDANVLGAGLSAESGALFEVLRAWRSHEYDLVYSEHLMVELVGMWNKPYWNARLSNSFKETSFRAIRRRGLRVEPAEGINKVATHWQDDLVIATAVAGNANYLVTGDKELLRLKSYRTVSIISPLEILEAESNADTLR